MRFYGLQKLTLLDYPGHTACTVFTKGCILRCPFCHNASLVLPERDPGHIEEEDIFKFLSKRKGLLDGVAVSGGEPLLHEELKDFLMKVRSLGFRIKLDTCGFLPDRLRELLDLGLVDHVAVDIKNSPEKYAVTAGIPSLDLSRLYETIDMLIKGDISYEFRTTVVSEFHTVSDISSAASMIKGASSYFLQNFEDSGDLIGSGYHAVSPDTMRQMIKAAEEYVPNTFVRGITL